MSNLVATAEAAATAAGLWAALPAFLLGYVLLLAVPGPNLLAVGAVAALRGLRGALPLCAGIACGAGALALALLTLAGDVGGVPSVAEVGRVAAGALLLGVAAAVLRTRPPVAPPVQDAAATDRPRPRRGRAAGTGAFLAGFATAVTNPMTAAFFVTQGLGPVGRAAAAPDAAAAAVLVPCAAVVAVALGFWVAVAGLLANPAVRRGVLAWHRPVRIASAGALAALAGAMLWPVAEEVAVALVGWAGTGPG